MMTTMKVVVLSFLLLCCERVVSGLGDSVNLELEILSKVDVTPLGNPYGLKDRYNATYDLTTTQYDEDDNEERKCHYTLRLELRNMVDNLEADTPGPSNFDGECARTEATGINPSTGLPYHTQRKEWVQFPSYVYETTGFDHLSVNWVPCGTEPMPFAKARYDLNFFTVLPQYRTFMKCDTFKVPEICQYDQTSHQGRSQFTVPRLSNAPNSLANMPKRFGPDVEFPEAYEYEGLINFDPESIPASSEEWKLPTFVMSTYDASVVSWRAMIPHDYINDKETASSSQEQFYVFQTMVGLPSRWEMSFDRSTQTLSVTLHGTSVNGICGADFDAIKREQEEEQQEEEGGGYGGSSVVFEETVAGDDDSSSNIVPH